MQTSIDTDPYPFNKVDIVVDRGGRNESLRILVFCLDLAEFKEADENKTAKLTRFGIFALGAFFLAPHLLEEVRALGASPDELYLIRVTESGDQLNHLVMPLVIDES